ncbi:hypothetical protein J6590_049493 [Homalodisca vitripennis]|nr:hypothetical protein J6590_049493 [Homalodisca vitripennis]
MLLLLKLGRDERLSSDSCQTTVKRQTSALLLKLRRDERFSFALHFIMSQHTIHHEQLNFDSRPTAVKRQTPAVAPEVEQRLTTQFRLTPYSLSNARHLQLLLKLIKDKRLNFGSSPTSVKRKTQDTCICF